MSDGCDVCEQSKRWAHSDRAVEDVRAHFAGRVGSVLTENDVAEIMAAVYEAAAESLRGWLAAEEMDETIDDLRAEVDRYRKELGR